MNRSLGMAGKTTRRVARRLFSLVLVLALYTIIGGMAVAQSGSRTVVAPKWLETPTLDGRCADSAYDHAGTVELLDQSNRVTAPVKLFHSAVDFYVCFTAIPVGIERQVLVRVDARRGDRRPRIAQSGNYEFSVTASGITRATQASANGNFVPLTVPDDAFAARVSTLANQTWSAELRIPLDWLGGYARTDAVYLEVRDMDGTTFQQWPGDASGLSPQTWGDLVLAPLYPDQVVAGSAFVDGRGGYFVVPYAPELYPPEMTIQGWVSISKGGCGPLLSDGAGLSYWLALCNTLQFGYAGASTASSGQIPLSEGWHNVAITMDDKGVRTFYVDGQLDVQPGWKPIEWPVYQELERHAMLGHSDAPLLIGGSSHSLPGQPSLHGYLRDLAVWDRVLSADEVRRAAFQRLTGNEPGLLALWPFVNGLQDIAGGHDAGRIANASLAREAPHGATFSEEPSFPRLQTPTRAPIPTWDGNIPLVSTPIVVDGACTTREYQQAANIVLEPDRIVAMYMSLGPDALYLCTTLLVGQPGPGNGVTLWIDRSGAGESLPNPAALRIRLTPDGLLEVGTGDSNGYGGPAPSNLVAVVRSGTDIHIQEDERALSVPHWSGEIQIPIAALAPFRTDQPLRIALQYEGTLPPNVVPEQPNGAIFSGHWPANFDASSPATWGTAQVFAPRDPVPLFPAKSTTDPTTAAPSEADFLSTCGPVDEKAGKAVSLARMVLPWMKWKLVDPAHPLQWAGGTMQEIHLAVEDSAGVHSTHDMDMKLDLPPLFRWLNIDAKIGSMQLESESGGFPPNASNSIQARPSVGDHVTTLGRWVYDCSHGYTELHPLYIVEHDRVELRPTLPDGPLEAVRVARVWLNSHPDPYNSITFPESFQFDVDIPTWIPSEEIPFVRIAAGDAGKVSWTRTGDRFTVTIKPPAATGQYYFEILIGHLAVPHKPWDADRPYTVWLDKIAVVHDKGGSWTLDVNVNGTWRSIFFRSDVDDSASTPDYGLHIPITTAEPKLTFQVTAYQGDTAYDYKFLWASDKPITSGVWHLGPLAKLAAGPQKLCNTTTDGDVNLDPSCAKWESSDWVLYYHVVPGGAVPSEADDADFWKPRLADEPNEYRGTPLGSGSSGLIHVPRPGEPAIKISHRGYITEQPFQHAQIRLVGPDVDRYTFLSDEFADVQFGSLPAGLKMLILKDTPKIYPGSIYSTYSSIPDKLLEMLGFIGAGLEVRSESGMAGNIPYDMNLTVSWRTLPPDWGEAVDGCYPSCRGRLVDLATPATATDVLTDFVLDKDLTHIETHHERDLQMDWAWQHTVGDLDHYDVFIPRAKVRPADQPACTWDQDPSLTVEAPGMRLVDVSSGIDFAGAITLTDPNGSVPSGHYDVTVRSPTDRRGIYRLSARWVDGTYLTPHQCKRVTEWYTLLHTLAAPTYPSNWFDVSRIVTWRPSPGGDPPSPWSGSMPLYALGAIVPVELREGDTIDALISSPAERPVQARLYDLNEVLMAESGSLTATSPGKARIPDGLLPQTQLTAGGLAAGGFYLLQVVPISDAGKDPAPLIRVGVSRR